MKRLLVACAAIMALTSVAVAGDRLAEGFANVPMANRPWCYWWWVNGHVDEETITADLEAMKRLGFGGLLMFDSRGYWDDERHIVNPKPEIAFMSPEWQRYVIHAIREAARLGLEFAMNMSSSGGKLDGPWDVGADAPKCLVYKVYPAGTTSAALEKPDFPFYRDIGMQTVWYVGDALAAPSDWRNGGDGVYTMSATSGNRLDGVADKPRTLSFPGAPDAKCVVVRFGYTVLPGHEHDVDVLDPRAVTGHFNRFQGTLMARIPGLVGRKRTLTHLYSVSWEGTMPTWTGDFEREFRKYAGFDIVPHLPQLAGFVDADAAANEAFMRAYRRTRNDMFRNNFYGTMRDLAHARDVGWVSESGGPWQRKPQIFREADQIDYLAVNDLPQGEYWPGRNGKGRYHVRAAVAAAHLYGLPRASAEAFTHMMLHWSVDPAHIKFSGDECFLGGVNHLVWHTFTCSPKKFGVPGAEYFAGTHINRNVTWHRELSAFVGYLGRCQWLLQQGRPVEDYAVYAGDRPYQHWGLYFDKPYESSKAKLPRGYAYDIVNDDALLNRMTLKDGRLVLPDGLSYGALVWDPEFPQEPLKPSVLAKVEEWKKGGLHVFSATEAEKVATLAPPDVEGPFRAVHRRDAVSDTDIYFVAGTGPATMIFRVTGRPAELWDAVTGDRRPAATTPTADGRTQVSLDLPKDGSVFVVFRNDSTTNRQIVGLPDCRNLSTTRPVSGPWQVSFAYHPGIAATPPASRTMEKLADWTTVDDLKYFAGTATYRTTVTLTDKEAARATRLSLGELPSGLATVEVNGTDCGIVWCAPWEAKASFRPGENTVVVRVTNNWYNRLVGDCFLPAEERVTRSTLRYWNVPRKKDPARPWNILPTVYSGYTTYDPLQPSGLVGPLSIK
ncbi:MAG: hypothetical protein IJI36_13835 [Kiritimatiellae bacterium]|nr:hypothetical protein [Kiritimatiellia bacterium]